MAVVSSAPLFDRSIEVQPGQGWSELATLAASPHTMRFRLDPDRRQAVFAGADEGQLAQIVKGFGRQMRNAYVLSPTTSAVRLRLSGTALVEATHSAISAAGGEFGQVKLLLWTGPPGSGLRFQSTARPDAVPSPFIPVIARALRQASEGLFADLHASLVNGAWHHQYSTSAAFERATQAALRHPDIVRLSRPAEPVARVVVTAPEACLPAIELELNRRGEVRHTDLHGAMRKVTLDAPATNLVGLALQLAEMAGASARCVMTLDHYVDVTPEAGGNLGPSTPSQRVAAPGRLELT
jgi:translation elongation factor EF-G